MNLKYFTNKNIIYKNCICTELARQLHKKKVRGLGKEEYIVRHCDVLIIGGGIIGCSIAYYTSKYGRDVTIIEKGICQRDVFTV